MGDPEELLDVVTPTGVPAGDPLPRSLVHKQGQWHQTFHCLVVRSDQPARVILQRRSPNTRAFANKVDFSATGHLQAGETPTDGIRELHEELGIDADPADLIPLGVRLIASDHGEGINRERVHAHLLIDDRPLIEFNPDPKEVPSLLEAKACDILALCADPTRTITATSWSPGHTPQEIVLTTHDLIHPTDYLALVTIMAERLANNQHPITI